MSVRPRRRPRPPSRRPLVEASWQALTVAGYAERLDGRYRGEVDRVRARVVELLEPHEVEVVDLALGDRLQGTVGGLFDERLGGLRPTADELAEAHGQLRGEVAAGDGVVVALADRREPR